MKNSTDPVRWTRRLLSWLPQVAIAGIVAALYLSNSLSLFDNKLTDLGYRLSSRPASGNVVLVEINAKSIDELKIWPWPRRYHAKVLDTLLAAGAELVAFDVDFSAHSRLEEDKTLEKALSRSGGKVILPAFSQLSRTPDGKTELKWKTPLPEFRRHAALASINVRPEVDSLIRTMEIQSGSIPSMAALLANAGNTVFGTFQIDYGIDPWTVPRLSYADILKGRFDASDVAGKKIVIGSTAVELGDQLAVPIFQTIPGPLIHILGYESLVQGRALLEVSALPISVGILISTLLLGPFFLRKSWQKSLIALVAVSAGLIALSLIVQISFPILINIVPILLSVLLSFSFAVIKRIDQQAMRLVFQSLDLRRKDVLMRNVVENSFDGIITMAPDGIIESANPAALRIFAETDIAGRSIREFFPDLQNADGVMGLLAVLRADKDPHELEGCASDKRTMPIEMSVSTVDADDSSILTMFFRDITDRKKQRDKLEHQANHDALTGLPNRKMFYDRVQETIDSANTSNNPFAVLLLDLDRFKEVNDTLGHPTGDSLLQMIAEKLQAATPDTDMIARIGGDEFALLLPSAASVSDALHASRKILEVVCKPFELADLTLEVAGSVGVAMYPQHGANGAALIKCADVAMYVAKRDQSGVEVYDEEKDQNSVRFLTLTGDLRRAIEDEQLVLHYQPKICLKTNRIIAVEALIRWIHPEHGFIPPDDFIDKAEQTGVIGPMTEWVLNTAMKQAYVWSQRGQTIDMAVNISARLLNDYEIVGLVREGLKKYAIPPASLILEVTENALMDDPAKAMEVITALSELGARISIDDFGTGYSSLGYLKDLPADEMKIDKCFVQSVHEDKSNETIVRSTINLAHGLGLKVVAEGIESEDISVLLADMGCDVGQGYMFSKPLPIEQFEEWLTTSPWGLAYSPSTESDMEYKDLVVASA